MTWAIGIGVVALLVLFSRGSRAARPPRITGVARTTGQRSTQTWTAQDIARLRVRVADILPRAQRGQATAEELGQASFDANQLSTVHPEWGPVAHTLGLYNEAQTLGPLPPELQARLDQARSNAPPSRQSLEALAATLQQMGYTLTARAVGDVAARARA